MKQTFEELIKGVIKEAIQEYTEALQLNSLNEERLYTISELASYSGFSTTTIRGWILRDYDPLPSFKINKEFRVSRKDFNNWIDNYRTDSKYKKKKLIDTV